VRTIESIHRITRIKIAMLYGATGFMCMVIGWAYLPWTSGPAIIPDALIFAENLIPLPVYGGMWFISGVLGIIAAYTQLQIKWFVRSMTSMGFMFFIWFCFYSVAYIFQGDDRAYLGAAIYGATLCALAAMAILIADLRPKVTKKHA
jgi:hypothetical protein